MTALILGADGFVGKNLSRLMKARGEAHIPIGRAAGDFTDPAVVQKAFAEAGPVKKIYHLITRQRTGSIQEKIQGELLAHNARIHLNILEAWRIQQPQARLIFPMSSCAYPESATPLKEDQFGKGQLNPTLFGYATAKLLLARGAEAYAKQYGLNYLGVVFATLYGLGDHTAPDRSHFVGALVTRAVKERREGKNQFTVWGDPKTVREILHVEDQIAAMESAEQYFNNDIINIATNSPIAVEEVVRVILDELSWSASVERPQVSFHGTAYKVLDSGRFLNTTGWKPRLALKQGIRALIEEAESRV